MKQVDKISLTELTEMSKKMYDRMVKAVVDIKHPVKRDSVRRSESSSCSNYHGDRT